MHQIRSAQRRSAQNRLIFKQFLFVILLEKGSPKYISSAQLRSAQNRLFEEFLFVRLLGKGSSKCIFTGYPEALGSPK